MIFEDRDDAGQRLAEALAGLDLLERAERVVVLGVPRGGIPVGVRVALLLDVPFDVVVIRKLRSPHNLELGFGAVGPGGHVDVDQALVERLGLTTEEVEQEIADRSAAVRARLAVYRDVVAEVELTGATVIVVDDGIATGNTARQACSWARRADAEVVVLAVPVAPAGVADELGEVVDHVLVLSEPSEFLAVGQAYRDFEQLDDETVAAALSELVGPELSRQNAASGSDRPRR